MCRRAPIDPAYRLVGNGRGARRARRVKRFGEFDQRGDRQLMDIDARS
jgi:hypothetical protein